MTIIDEILNFAIDREEEAAAFYTELAGKAKQKHMADLLLSFAAEERGHKAKLLAVKGGKRLAPKPGKVMDLQIADYTVDVKPSANMRYEDVLIVAMKNEKAAFRLYTDLAATADDPETQQTFLALAQEEAKHKLRFELEYDERVLAEN